MNAIDQNDMYRELVMSSVRADLLDNGYLVTFPVKGGADCIVSKPNGKAFAVEFRSYKDLRYFFDSALSKKKRNTEMLGRRFPVSYVGVDSQAERVAVERSLAQKLGSYASRLDLREYVAS